MDPLSQGLTGAVLAQSFAKKKELRNATLAGLVGGMIADLDVLIKSSSDPLLNLDFHRHFTHSLIFIPIGGLIAGLILWPFLRHKMRFSRIFLFATLGYGTAGLLDACTSYGTHLLWPFSEQRSAWNIISIIDPIYTLVLLAAVLIAFFRWRPRHARLGLLFGLIYMALGYVQRERVQDALESVAEQRGEMLVRSEVKPTLGNRVLWRGIYQSGEYYRVDAYRMGMFSPAKIYQGEQRPVFKLSRDLPLVESSSVLAKDIARFENFSDGYLVLNSKLAEGKVLGDLRYSMLPTSASPLWGIVFDPKIADQHVSFENFRKLNLQDKQIFVDMLLGR